MRTSLRLVALAATLCSGCRHESAAGSSAPAPSEPASATLGDAALADSSSRAKALQLAELTRKAGVVRVEDLSSRDVQVRRAAARTLAQHRTTGEQSKLLLALADEDAEVVAWAALGLADTCTSTRDAVVTALASRAASLRGQEDVPSGASALASLARAIGRCAADHSERVLLDWASSRSTGSEDALFGIGDAGAARGRFREEIAVGLLELAAGSASAKPWATALQPLTRVAHLPVSVIERARDVALARLADGAEEKIHAIRVLGRTDERAVPTLVELVRNPDKASATERAEGVRALARLGGVGQRGLRIVLSSLVPDVGPSGPMPAIEGADFGPLLVTVESLTDIEGARQPLDRLSKLDSPSDALPTIVRRVSQLRCASAKLVAERDFNYAPLARCDRTASNAEPGQGTFGARAMVASIAIEGTELVGKRLRAWEAYANGGDHRARAAAIEAIAVHPELSDPESPLVAALESGNGAVVAAAADVIAKHPDRIRARTDIERRGRKRKGHKPDDKRVGKALALALNDGELTSDIEVLVKLADAAGAALADEAREPLSSLCRSPYAIVRDHAARALSQLLGGDRKFQCAPEDAEAIVPDEFERQPTSLVSVVLESDAGELRLALDPLHAPVAVARLRDLVKEGFYDGMIIHRVVPGFVVQLGSPTFDGFGGPKGRPALPCETSWQRFFDGSVGMALAGRDTGSSQFFVTLSALPQLDGQYAWLGRASGPWSSLVEGDRIVRARLAP